MKARSAAAVNFSGGAMVAFYPRMPEAQALAVADGQAADSIHLTLLYLGSAEQAAPMVPLIQSVAGGVASAAEALEGEVGGVAQFEEGPDGTPIVALPDVDGLTELREELCAELSRIGVESASEHGFTPHMTLAYDADPNDYVDRLGMPLHFDAISVVVGSDRVDYPLQSPPQTILSAVNHPSAVLPSGGPMRNRKRSLAADVAAPNASQLRWQSVLMLEGDPTDDGRMIEPGAIDWRELPLSLMAMIETGPGGHEGAQVAGRIDEIWRVEQGDGTNLIMGRGVFDDGEFGSEIARLVSEGMLRGVSVDLSIRDFEFRPKEEPEEPAGDEDPDLLDLLFGTEMLYVVTDGSIAAATVCSIPAFADAEIALLASSPLTWRVSVQSGMTIVRPAASSRLAEAMTDAEAPTQTPGEAVSASAAGLAPEIPPAEWFDDPDLLEPTPMTITDKGRIFGHAAVWNVCHIGFSNDCVLAPRTKAGYAYFHLGEVEVDLEPSVGNASAKIPCGSITLGTGHASLKLKREQAVEHYDDTGTAIADVCVGEDEFGIWIAGAVRSDAPVERVRELRASKLSGDWRNVDGNLELVALLAVNVPGFPVPRVRVAAADTEQPIAAALISAGVADRDLLDALAERDEAELKIADLRAEAIGMDDLIRRARGEAVAA